MVSTPLKNISNVRIIFPNINIYIYIHIYIYIYMEKYTMFQTTNQEGTNPLKHSQSLWYPGPQTLTPGPMINWAVPLPWLAARLKAPPAMTKPGKGTRNGRPFKWQTNQIGRDLNVWWCLVIFDDGLVILGDVWRLKSLSIIYLVYTIIINQLKKPLC